MPEGNIPTKVKISTLLIEFTKQKWIMLFFLIIVLIFLILIVLYHSYFFFLSYKKTINPNRFLSNKKALLYNRKLLKIILITLLRVIIILHFIFKCVSGENYSLDNKYSFIVLARFISFIAYFDNLFKCFNFNGINSSISTFIYINSKCIIHAFKSYFTVYLLIAYGRHLSSKSFFNAYSSAISFHILFLIYLLMEFKNFNFYLYLGAKPIASIKNNNKKNLIDEIANSLNFNTKNILISDSFLLSYKPPKILKLFNIQQYNFILISDSWINTSSNDKIYSYLATDILALNNKFIKNYFTLDFFYYNIFAILIYCGIYINFIGFYLGLAFILWILYKYLRLFLQISNEYYYIENIDNYIMSKKRIKKRILKGLIIIFEQFVKNKRSILQNNKHLDFEKIDFRICKLQSV